MLASNKFYNVTLYSLVKFSKAYYGGIVQLVCLPFAFHYLCSMS